MTLRAISGHRDTGPSECPGHRRLRPAARDREARSRDRAAEALLADGRRRARRPRPFPGAPLLVARRGRSTIVDQLGKTVAPGAGRGRRSTGRGARSSSAQGAFTRGRSARRARAPATGTSVCGGRCRHRPRCSLTNLAALAGRGRAQRPTAPVTSSTSLHARRAAAVDRAACSTRAARRCCGSSTSSGRRQQLVRVGAAPLPDGRYRLVVTAKSGDEERDEGRPTWSSTGR